MTPISAFVPFVAAKVAKDMPLANIQHAIRETLVFFLEQTRAAVAELYLDLHCHEDELLVDLPQCRRLVGVEGVYLVPSSQCGPTHGQVRWRPTWEKFPFANNEGENGWSVDDGDGDLTTLWLLPASQKERRVCVRYSWTPKRDATCEVPDWVFERFADAIKRIAAEIDTRESAELARIRNTRTTVHPRQPLAQMFAICIDDRIQLGGIAQRSASGIGGFAGRHGSRIGSGGGGIAGGGRGFTRLGGSLVRSSGGIVGGLVVVGLVARAESQHGGGQQSDDSDLHGGCSG